MNNASENETESLPTSASDKKSSGSKIAATNGKSSHKVGDEKKATDATKNGEVSVQSSSGGSGEAVLKSDRVSNAKLEPLGVSVETNLDKAMKILKRKLIKEGLFKELKTRRYFEKPSEKKKRKMKETLKKLRKEESRARKNSLI